MPKFRRIPMFEIEAIQLHNTRESIYNALHFIDDPKFSKLAQTFDNGIVVPTREGNLLASWEDWIIKGVEGEFYPCKPDTFIKLYEPVD